MKKLILTTIIFLLLAGATSVQAGRCFEPFKPFKPVKPLWCHGQWELVLYCDQWCNCHWEPVCFE